MPIRSKANRNRLRPSTTAEVGFSDTIRQRFDDIAASAELILRIAAAVEQQAAPQLHEQNTADTVREKAIATYLKKHYDKSHLQTAHEARQQVRAALDNPEQPKSDPVVSSIPDQAIASNPQVDTARNAVQQIWNDPSNTVDISVPVAAQPTLSPSTFPLPSDDRSSDARPIGTQYDYLNYLGSDQPQDGYGLAA